MAGTVTMEFSKVAAPYVENRGIIKVSIDWVADASDGSVPQTDFDSTDMIDILGRYCIMATTNPGSTAPTNLYDIEILDEDGIDVFGANLKNRSASDSEQVVPKIGMAYGGRVCTGTWTFKLTNNSVNSATGNCTLYFEV